VPPESPVVLGCAGHKTATETLIWMDGGTGPQPHSVSMRSIWQYPFAMQAASIYIYLYASMISMSKLDKIMQKQSNSFISQDQLPQEPFTVFIDKPISVLSSKSSDKIKPLY
jgi:hypothetical protein